MPGGVHSKVFPRRGLSKSGLQSRFWRLLRLWWATASLQRLDMLLLTAILHVWQPRDIEPNDLLAESRQRLGHVGLTVIALVFLLVTFWQQ